MPELGAYLSTRKDIQHADLPSLPTIASMVRWVRGLSETDLLLVNTDATLTLRLAAASIIAQAKLPLVSLDCLLGLPPTTAMARLATYLKKILLARVDHFLLPQRDTQGLERLFHLNGRTSYFPFKVNAWQALQSGDLTVVDEGYVIHAGRTMRDIRTFIEAMRITKLPTVLLYQDQDTGREHGTSWTLSALPENVVAVKHNGDPRSYQEYLARARVIVVAIESHVVTSAGISTILDGIGMGKCVVATDCPAVRGVFTDEIAVVPANDSTALGATVLKLFQDEHERDELAMRAHRAAGQFGGTERYLRDIVDFLSSRFGASASVSTVE